MDLIDLIIVMFGIILIQALSFLASNTSVGRWDNANEISCRSQALFKK